MIGALVLGFFGGLLAGAGIVREFDTAAARDIRSQLQGEERRVSVHTRAGASGIWGDVGSVRIRARNFSTDGLPLFVEPARSKAGKLRRLILDLENFSLGPVAIARLHAEISDCRFDRTLAINRKRMRLSQSGVGTGWVEITTAALEAFTLKKFPEIRRCAMTARNDRLNVRGFGEFLVIQTEFEVDAALEVRNGSQLWLTDARITFDGVLADPLSRDAVLRTMNPIVDLDADLKLFGAIQVARITLANDRLRAEGPTRIPVRPANSALPESVDSAMPEAR